MGDFTTLYLRGMPRQLVREAKAAAARRGSTLTSLVSDTLARSLGSGGGADPGNELRGDMEWYEKNRTRLLRKYAGQYVAIVDHTLLDHDDDFETLAARVFETVGVRSVFMPRVQAGGERVRIRSPRRARG